MLILNKELKNKYVFNNLNPEISSVYNNSKVYFYNGQSIHYPSSTKEWYNSVCNFYKNKNIKRLLIKDIEIYRLFNGYFNYYKLTNSFYLSKIFIGKPEIKHFNNKTNITLYIYNRQIVCLKKYFFYYKNIFLNILNEFLQIESNQFNLKNINLTNIYTKFSLKILYDILKTYVILNKYKFNINNLLYLKNLLYYVYNKRIELNLINLKYLHLDSYILCLIIEKKLKRRNSRVLRIIRLALSLSKKLEIQEYSTCYLNLNYTDSLLIKKDVNKLLKKIPFNKNIIQKPVLFNNRIVLYYLKNKIIKGIRLQGDGRLTKRLTASRSIVKNSYIGSLKNYKSSVRGLSTVLLKGYVKSNLQYTNINSYNIIGAYGIKSWISNY